MKFPDFSLTFPVEASKDYPVSSVYRYGQHCRSFIIMKNTVRLDSQLFNSWGFNSWGKGMGCPLPSQLGAIGEHQLRAIVKHCKLPQAEKQVLVFRA